MSYVDDVLAQMKEKDAHEPEFLQVLTEILDSLRPIIEANEEKYRKEALGSAFLRLIHYAFNITLSSLKVTILLKEKCLNLLPLLGKWPVYLF